MNFNNNIYYIYDNNVIDENDGFLYENAETLFTGLKFEAVSNHGPFILQIQESDLEKIHLEFDEIKGVFVESEKDLLDTIKVLQNKMFIEIEDEGKVIWRIFDKNALKMVFEELETRQKEEFLSDIISFYYYDDGLQIIK